MHGGVGSGDIKNVIYFGDSSVTENSNVEVTALSFSTASGAHPDIDVDMEVNNPSPLINEVVEFTITVRNIGATLAEDVLIHNILPAEMSIPDGSSALESIGNYNPDTGEWVIGRLDIGIEATLVIPAVVTTTQPPACIVNFASSDHPRDTNSLNDDAHALIKLDADVRCVDISVSFGISADSNNWFPSCDSHDRYDGEVRVTNDGQDAARNVEITIGQNPVIGPNLRFDDSDCTNSPSSHCSLGEVAAEETITIEVTSDLYQSYSSFEQTISVSATTTDSDYIISNNNPSASGRGGGFSNCNALPGIPEVSIIGGVGSSDIWFLMSLLMFTFWRRSLTINMQVNE